LESALAARSLTVSDRVRTGRPVAEGQMDILIKTMIGLAALAFVMAVAGSTFISSGFLGIQPEGYSRACSNLALIAIGLSLGFKESSPTA
jgi:hypothetical protein